MEFNTYSAQDVSIIISHPLVGQKQIVGSSFINCKTSFTDNLTESELGADGSVMITKVQSQRGTITIELQQTSSAHKWLTNYANVLASAPRASWAQGSINIQEMFDNGVKKTAQQMAIVKRPDDSDEVNGSHVTWEFFTPALVRA